MTENINQGDPVTGTSEWGGGGGRGDFELTEFEIAGFDCISIGILTLVLVLVFVLMLVVSVSGTLLITILCIATLLTLITIHI